MQTKLVLALFCIALTAQTCVADNDFSKELSDLMTILADSQPEHASAHESHKSSHHENSNSRASGIDPAADLANIQQALTTVSNEFSNDNGIFGNEIMYIVQGLQQLIGMFSQFLKIPVPSVPIPTLPITVPAAISAPAIPAVPAVPPIPTIPAIPAVPAVPANPIQGAANALAGLFG